MTEYLVRQRIGRELVNCETIYRSEDAIVADIMSGDIDRPVEVFAFWFDKSYIFDNRGLSSISSNRDISACMNITLSVAKRIADQLNNEMIEPTDGQRDFVEEHLGINRLIDAVDKVRG